MSESTISPDEEALRDAIQIEVRNTKIYEAFASMFSGYDEDVNRIFLEMAEEEKEHEDVLRKRYEQRFPGHGPLGTEGSEPTEVIEAPELPDAEAFIFDSMDVRQALEAGLRAEKEAQEFYRQLIPTTTDELLQETYRELSEFEDSHVRTLEDKLAALELRNMTNERG